HILENLAIFSQGRNQFFPIVMRAGRDFKGRLTTSYFFFDRIDLVFGFFVLESIISSIVENKVACRDGS
ncbi:hypothetical protein, partial [Hallerella porci]|uniref:hypothetical protein n=1 Tax=Hallerella porci TaxID=1945871 RepID=UPI001E4DF164